VQRENELGWGKLAHPGFGLFLFSERLWRKGNIATHHCYFDKIRESHK